MNTIEVTPVSGQGNETFSIASTKPNTGRDVKFEFFAAYGTNFKVQRNFTVKQEGKVEFLTVDTAKLLSYNDTSVTIKGKSNTDVINFSFLSNQIGLVLGGTYKVNGATANINQMIQFDPGATEEYDFEITFDNIPENVGGTDLISVLRVGNSVVGMKQCVITQSFHAITLKVVPAEANLNSDGDMQSFVVDSDSAWTITNPGWSGSTDVLTVTPDNGITGVTTVEVTSDANEGLDRHVYIEVDNGDMQRLVTVYQVGKYQEFAPSDDDLFVTSDDEDFWVVQ